MSISKESFKAKAMELNSGIKLAKGRTKGEDEKGNSLLPFKTVVNMDNFEISTAVIDGKESEFAAFTIKEDTEHFYFGGSVITDTLKQFTEEERQFIIDNTVPVMFEKVKSKVKGHNDYTKITFYPEEEEF